MSIREPESGQVRPEELTVDHTYQRPLETSRLEPGGKLYPFRPYAVGSVSVSRRKDGTLWLLDGQHRMEQALRMGHSKTLFPAQVYSGLSLEEEAYLFGKLNEFRNVHPVHRFRARVVEGEKVATAINKVVNKHSWRIGAGATKGSISAVNSLEWVYNGGRLREEGMQEQVLDRTLQILTTAFGHASQAVNASIIKGLGLVLLRHGERVETVKIINELGAIEGGPYGLLGRAKALKGIRGGDLPNSVAEIIAELHNSRRRSNLLPQWTRA